MNCTTGNTISINSDYREVLSDTSSSVEKELNLHRDYTINITELGPDEYNTQNEAVLAAKGIYKTQIREIFRIELKLPLTVIVTEELDHCLFDCKELDIFEAGEDYHDAMINFCQFFTSDLEYWQSMEDEKLTKDALILKKKYLKYV